MSIISELVLPLTIEDTDRELLKLCGFEPHKIAGKLAKAWWGDIRYKSIIKLSNNSRRSEDDGTLGELKS